MFNRMGSGPWRLRGLSLLMVVAALSGCAAEAMSGDELKGSDPDEPADIDPNQPVEVVPVEHEDDFELRLSLEQSPAEVVDGAWQFNFETDEVPGQVNLTNAAWLAWFSANEYSHFGALAPALADLGFGKGFEGIEWRACSNDMDVLRGMLEEPELYVGDVVSDIRFGREFSNCFRNFFWATIAVARGELPDENGYQGFTYLLPEGMDAEEFLESWIASFNHFLVQTCGTYSVSGDSQCHNTDNYIQFFSGGEWDIEGRGLSDDATEAEILTTEEQYKFEFEQSSTQLVWARHGTRPIVIVAFRGTEMDEHADRLANLQFFKKNMEKAFNQDDNPNNDWPRAERWGRVHRGFLKGYMSVENDMLLAKLRALAEESDTPPQIWVTGHSLGASLATIFSARVLAEMDDGLNVNLAGVYAFGSPRVGNDDFMAEYNASAARNGANIVRLRNGNDSFCRIPRWGFDHVGTMFHIERTDGRITGTRNYCSDTLPDEPLLSSIRDHYIIDAYFEGLMSMRERAVSVPDPVVCR